MNGRGTEETANQNKIFDRLFIFEVDWGCLGQRSCSLWDGLFASYRWSAFERSRRVPWATLASENSSDPNFDASKLEATRHKKISQDILRTLLSFVSSTHRLEYITHTREEFLCFLLIFKISYLESINRCRVHPRSWATKSLICARINAITLSAICECFS